MTTADPTVLRAGEFLSLGSLVSPNGAYALEHRGDGTLALRDRSGGHDIWAVTVVQGEPDVPQGESGRLVLHPDQGRLVLEARSGLPVWVSGPVDRRVVAASVTDQGRLVLTDPDGALRWSRDPLTEADLAAHRPASGDRLLPGQILTEPLFSPDGRYRFGHTPDGTTRLTAHENDRERGVWSLDARAPGPLTLGTDGILRSGTDSMVLLRWTGRYRLDPTAFRVSAVVVRDQGDIVVLDDNGDELCDSRTAPEEARLAGLRRSEERRAAREAARPERPAGSGLPRDWFDLLDLSGPCTLTLVEHSDAEEVLRRLGAGPGTIRPMTYAELVAAAFSGSRADPPECALAARVGDRVVVVEPCGLEGVERAAELSRGGGAIVRHLDFDGWESLTWYQDGTLLATYGEDDATRLERGKAAPRGTRRAAFAPFMERIGLGVYRTEEEDGEFLPPTVELACLAAGVRLRREDFEGAHPAAVFGTGVRGEG
ncbi:DUF6461 domain-containing protein [Streptomyces sp. NPDC003247]|uniref:DUF6461 domain-containing protein n=1 Tax=Streptomyces sp. NPDC003247 TaxID=3364677 RepID=UPI003673D8C0